MNSQYTSLAAFYDSMCGRDNKKWTEYLISLLEENGIRPGELVLDCACGTGTLTAELARVGYDMIGFDISEQMLGEAYENTSGLGVLLLCQSLTDFELYGTVRAALCNMDSLNYLPSLEDIDKYFSLCNNYIEPGGVLIFDINTPYKFKNIYSDRDYIIENDEGSMLCWSCDFDGSACRFALTVFSPRDDGLWEREDEEQTEYCHDPDAISALLEKNGFKIKSIFASLTRSEPSESEERIHFVCIREGKDE